MHDILQEPKHPPVQVPLQPMHDARQVVKQLLLQLPTQPESQVDLHVLSQML